MNPSYTNGVGAQVPPSNPQISGQPVGQQQPTPLRQVGQQPIQQPVMPQQPIISSGAGDVVLSGGGSEKKSRKGAVILIVLVVLVALVGGGYLMWQNGAFGGNDGNSENLQQSDLQATYNSYVNYVLWGVESDSRPDLAAMEQARPYFMSLQGNNDSTELDAYLARAEERYNSLKNAYDATNKENKVDIAMLKAYFEDYVRMSKLTQDEMLAVYLDDGEQKVKALINNTYNIKNESLNELSTAKKELSETLLDITIKTVAAGCVQDKKIKSGCYQLTNDEKQALSGEAVKVANSEDNLMNKAREVMFNLYNELYGNAETISGGAA